MFMSDPEKCPVETTDYHAYLLRIWREEEGCWRVSLQSTRTRERFGFADLHAAVQFMERELGQGGSEWI